MIVDITAKRSFRRIVAAFACWAMIPAAFAASGGENANTAAVGPESMFLKENDAAMSKMMDGMAVKPCGDVDDDFVAMMIPHHQGAIDMAQAELRYGKNEQLRRIAQEIIVEQQQEIVAMRVALGQSLPPSVPSPDQIHPRKSIGPAHSSMQHMDMPSSSENHGDYK